MPIAFWLVTLVASAVPLFQQMYYHLLSMSTCRVFLAFFVHSMTNRIWLCFESSVREKKWLHATRGLIIQRRVEGWFKRSQAFPNFPFWWKIFRTCCSAKKREEKVGNLLSKSRFGMLVSEFFHSPYLLAKPYKSCPRAPCAGCKTNSLRLFSFTIGSPIFPPLETCPDGK